MVINQLTHQEIRQLRCPVKCKIAAIRIRSLADYFAGMSSLIAGTDTFWFRGHSNISWELKPSALRYPKIEQRESALKLMRDFRKIAEIKLSRPPNPDENLKWMQLAQHYGIPTRLLDWTESAIYGLYFACADMPKSGTEKDGIVYLFNPMHLIKLAGINSSTALDAPLDEKLIKRYFAPDGKQRSRGLPTITIKPIWNDERLMMQRGVFTLHGSRSFALDETQAPSLVGIPILKESKIELRRQLDKIGVDEMAIFPELEHACSNLKRLAGLD